MSRSEEQTRLCVQFVGGLPSTERQFCLVIGEDAMRRSVCCGRVRVVGVIEHLYSTLSWD